ncbi:PaaI family thioesterase [Sandarakinorhabdus rubra]|uniref:PaaI family thioesterase n=1 Tax=Sandarakinorhabdus rubra TaxID=2672568 RepID=UPI0013D950B8|nr:PaaI family thioesterase [Sandarakinorhabdus rubra]
MTNPALASLLSQPSGRLDMLPYAALLDLAFERVDDELQLIMPFDETLIGSPGRLHGGAISGLLELAGLLTVIAAQPEGEALPRVRPVTVTVDFMREGATQETRAAASITKLGRRVVNVHAQAWQGSREKPTAAAHINFVLDWPER